MCNTASLVLGVFPLTYLQNELFQRGLQTLYIILAQIFVSYSFLEKLNIAFEANPAWNFQSVNPP